MILAGGTGPASPPPHSKDAFPVTSAFRPARVALAVLLCLPLVVSATGPAGAFPDIRGRAAAAPPRLLQLNQSSAAPALSDRTGDLRPTSPVRPIPPVTAQPVAPAPSSAPVLYLHGALLGPGCVGTDVTGPAGGLAAVLRRLHWTGPVHSVTYYCADSTRGAVDIRGAARPTADTSITDIARLLAWYVYRTYSSRGVAVDLVGHSMGGLIIRDALLHAGQRGFPAYLRVRDVVTISTPHTGIPTRASCPLQCQQMSYGSAYLAGLARPGGPPQGRGGTTWTEIGGSPCDYIPGESTLALGAALRVDLSGTAPTCYTHVSYLGDVSSARDLPATVTLPNGRVEHVTGPHALEWVYQALLR
jgi:pimeloyl-ACP methyl ester carboxylesterase